MKSTMINGSKTPGVKDSMAGFEKALPQETLDAHNILPSQLEPQQVAAFKQEPIVELPVKKKRAKNSQEETSHATNVNNFHTEIAMVSSFTNYNPPTARLTEANLQVIEADANLAIAKVDQKLGTFKVAVNLRQFEFDSVSGLATRVYGQFIACGTSKKAQSDYRTYKRKLDGRRAENEKVDPNDPTEKSVSASQMSFAQRIQHFQGIITTCIENGYTANEVDLTIVALTAKKDAMVLANDGMADAYTDVTQARIARDRVLYAAITGLVPIALDVKEYVKAMFGFTSREFRMVYHLHFRNLGQKFK